jgi:hypothetical protein
MDQAAAEVEPLLRQLQVLLRVQQFQLPLEQVEPPIPQEIHHHLVLIVLQLVAQPDQITEQGQQGGVDRAVILTSLVAVVVTILLVELAALQYMEAGGAVALPQLGALVVHTVVVVLAFLVLELAALAQLVS